MTAIIAGVIVVLVGLLVGSVWVIFSLLRRLDAANSALQTQASTTLAMAQTATHDAPQLIDRMLVSLSDATSKIHATIESTVRTVLTPPPMTYIDGATGQPYQMPTMPDMAEGKEPGQWDHTDKIIPDQRLFGPHTDPGYEHEADPDFDPANPFGIPGMTSI